MTNWQRSFALLYLNGESPEFRSASIVMTVPERLQKLKIQCRANDGVELTSLERIVGAALPASPMDKAGTNPTVFWTSPWEWLLVTRNLDFRSISRELASVLADTLHALTDVSDSLAVIELRGPRAGALLSEGCGVDLDAIRFPAGRYALTRLEQLAVIIHCISTEPIYHVYVDRNAAFYLWKWFQDGARLLA